MPGLSLLDNSAWARSLRPGLPRRIAFDFASNLVSRNFAVCLPFRLEASYSARNSRQFERINEAIDRLPQYELTATADRRAIECHAQLVATGHHRVPPVDLMIAAIADVEGLGVLHYDADYDLILEHSDLRFESRWLAPRGSL